VSRLLRRCLLLAAVMILFCGRSAWAQTDGGGPGEGGQDGTQAPATIAGPEGAGHGGSVVRGSLAPTASSDLVPLVEGLIILAGGCSLLLLVAWRRYRARRSAP